MMRESAASDMLFDQFPKEYHDHPLTKSLVGMLAGAALTKTISYDEAEAFARYMGTAFQEGIFADEVLTSDLIRQIEEGTSRQ